MQDVLDERDVTRADITPGRVREARSATESVWTILGGIRIAYPQLLGQSSRYQPYADARPDQIRGRSSAAAPQHGSDPEAAPALRLVAVSSGQTSGRVTRVAQSVPDRA